ncbi:prepilin-type N-terminal cleavage/methylation domain-containing protein [uncultured Desulfobulbus sp.]|uniref:type IV pilus modification PilV family protein n=1 Tax=uncultured Desulfobulbus sp. TaxID=239745 RepID=UPI0029C7C66E|nr:prepilin-type N-terminal cleavage/methylation domain-containing protein [uncultured Desulfobulbus sp.]
MRQWPRTFSILLNPRPGRGRGGFTLTEMVISVGISSLILIAVSSLQLISAKTISEVYGTTRTRSSRMAALDQIRYKLASAQIGSCVINDSNRTITFRDPNLTGSSRYYFVTSQKTLYYDQLTTDGVAARAIVKGPIDLTFKLMSVDNTGTEVEVLPGENTSAVKIVQLLVKSSSNMTYGDVDIQDGITSVYLRNR